MDLDGRWGAGCPQRRLDQCCEVRLESCPVFLKGRGVAGKPHRSPRTLRHDVDGWLHRTHECTERVAGGEPCAGAPPKSFDKTIERLVGVRREHEFPFQVSRFVPPRVSRPASGRRRRSFIRRCVRSRRSLGDRLDCPACGRRVKKPCDRGGGSVRVECFGHRGAPTPQAGPSRLRQNARASAGAFPRGTRLDGRSGA